MENVRIILEALGSLNIGNVIILAILGYWAYQKIDKRFQEIDKKIEKKADQLDKKLDKKADKSELDNVILLLKETLKETKEINTRLSRLEGRFEERGYWESRVVQIPKESKKKIKGE